MISGEDKPPGFWYASVIFTIAIAILFGLALCGYNSGRWEDPTSATEGNPTHGQQ